MKSNLISVIATVLVMAAATAAYGASYYVDANYGNDGWDGTTAAIPDPAMIEAGGTIAGPRKTLHAMMSDARVTEGDTVYAAEGDYNEGGDVYGTQVTSNRVQVKAGVMLCATGAREATFMNRERSAPVCMPAKPMGEKSMPGMAAWKRPETIATEGLRHRRFIVER